MMSAEQLARYRKMTPGERFRVTSELTRSAWAALGALPQAERRRRWEIMRREQEASNRRLAEALRALR